MLLLGDLELFRTKARLPYPCSPAQRRDPRGVWGDGEERNKVYSKFLGMEPQPVHDPWPEYHLVSMSQRRWAERLLEIPLPDPLTEDTEREKQGGREELGSETGNNEG